MARVPSTNAHSETVLSSTPTDQISKPAEQRQSDDQAERHPAADSPPTTKVENDVEVSSASPPYSVFSTPQKKWIVFIAASAGWFSTASSFIYFPAIPFLAGDLGVSIQKINLTVTSYLIASGIFPSIVGNAADHYGRRPVFIVSIGVYIAVNIGIALQRSFAALVTLRMLQSAAISGTFSFAYGVLGDLSTPADRGGYVGFISIFLNTPPSVSPLISGLLLIRWKWPAIFWFLCIVSSMVFATILVFLPETCRRLVGNGSVRAPWANRPLFAPLSATNTTRSSSSPRTETGKLDSLKNATNPFAALALLRKRGTGTGVVCYGIYYTIYSCLQASLSTIFVDIYGVSGLIAGLSYLPFGVACVTASSLAGKLLDFEYSRIAKSLDVTVDRGRADDLATFPIEHARLGKCKYSIALCAPLIVAYGWALQFRAHIAVPLVLQFCIGFTCQVNFTPSAIQAANNLVRCELAAGGIALLDVLLRSLGPGWCFVVYAALHIVTLPALWVIERCGLSWRKRNL